MMQGEADTVDDQEYKKQLLILKRMEAAQSIGLESMNDTVSTMRILALISSFNGKG